MRQNWSMPKLFADENYPADMLCGTTGKDLKNCSNWFSKFNERRENHLEARVKPIKDATGKVGTSRERNLLQKHLNKFTEIEKYFRQANRDNSELKRNSCEIKRNQNPSKKDFHEGQGNINEAKRLDSEDKRAQKECPPSRKGWSFEPLPFHKAASPRPTRDKENESKPYNNFPANSELSTPTEKLILQSLEHKYMQLQLKYKQMMEEASCQAKNYESQKTLLNQLKVQHAQDKTLLQQLREELVHHLPKRVKHVGVEANEDCQNDSRDLGKSAYFNRNAYESHRQRMAHSANKSKRNTYMSDESWTTSAKKIPSLKQIVRLDRKTNEELESDCEWMKTNKHCDNSQSQIKYHMSRLKQSQHEPPRSSINLGVEVSRLADSKVHLKKSWQIDRKQPQDQRTDLVKKKINQYAKYRFEPTLKIP